MILSLEVEVPDSAVPLSFLRGMAQSIRTGEGITIRTARGEHFDVDLVRVVHGSSLTEKEATP